MNCDTYLSMLETLPVSELVFGDAADHAANCRDCGRVTRVVAERERNMLLAYGTISPPVPTGLLAAHAVELSRRRRIAFYYRFALALAAIVAVLGLVVTRRVTPSIAIRDHQRRADRRAEARAGAAVETPVARAAPARAIQP